MKPQVLPEWWGDPHSRGLLKVVGGRPEVARVVSSAAPEPASGPEAGDEREAGPQAVGTAEAQEPDSGTAGKEPATETTPEALKPDEGGDVQTTHLPGRGLVAAVISSIGIRHEGALGLIDTGLSLDLSRVLRNPADAPGKRFRTDLDGNVHAHVLKTPGALTLINRTAVQLRALADEVPVGRLVRLTVACQGGRHRSFAAAEAAVGRLVREAWDSAYGIDIEHHHIDPPVLTAPSPT